MEIFIDSLYKSGKLEISIVDVVGLLNEGIQNSQQGINSAINSIFQGTAGEAKKTMDRYIELPKFTVDETRNVIYCHIPYYNQSI